MDKRYQVFVSSTFTDLLDERYRVMQALMEIECFPAGMELFPAADEEQWEYIKRVINDSDYYLLIVGGRYGSLTSEGISYTEKEYDYAVTRGLHVLAFLHAQPDDLPAKKTELDPSARIKLDSFRKRIAQGRLVRYWKSAEELQRLVTLSVSKTIRLHPAVGWVRGTSPTQELSDETVAAQENDPSSADPMNLSSPAVQDQQDNETLEILQRLLQKAYGSTEKRIFEVLQQVYSLKRIKRIGWTKRNIDGGDSIAEHVFMAALLAELFLPESLDTASEFQKTAIIRMLLLHDLPESFLGDRMLGEAITDLHETIREFDDRLLFTMDWGAPGIRKVLHEYDSGSTLNARIARDIDRLEAYIQLCLYSRSYTIEDLTAFKEALESSITTEVVGSTFKRIKRAFETSL
jgi:5'-deoxynucleotidase YfbR-like HD superfamily hydrolase